MTFYYLGFALLMFFDTAAQLCFKLTALHTLPVQISTTWIERILDCGWTYGAIAGYIGAFFTWMTLLRRLPVGPAFAASHLEVPSIMLCSAWLFHERLTLPRIFGALLILAGIAILAYAESRESTAS